MGESRHEDGIMRFLVVGRFRRERETDWDEVNEYKATLMNIFNSDNRSNDCVM